MGSAALRRAAGVRRRARAGRAAPGRRPVRPPADTPGWGPRPSTTPASGRCQVLLIEDAHRLTEAAGNVLLKAVEEPSPRTVWILCAPGRDDMLPPIRSRCRHLLLRTPPSTAVA